MKHQMKRQYGKKGWYCLNQCLDNGHGMQVNPKPAPVYIGTSVADKLGLKAEPWEHIMIIGEVTSVANGVKREVKGGRMMPVRPSCTIAIVKYIWDTRKITDVKYSNDYKLYEQAKLHGKPARDNHELLDESTMNKIYDKLDETASKKLEKQN